MQSYLKPLAAILTFLAGTFAVYLLAPLPNIQVAHDARYDEVAGIPETVSVCELERHPELYNGKTIRVRARVEMDEHDILIFDAQGCGAEPVRISCKAGYTSCLHLLEELRFYRTGPAEIAADGRFHAAVLEHHVTCKADSIVPVFEIAETRALKMEGSRRQTGWYDDARPCDRGTGSGTGHGSGDGNGRGYGSGSGSGGG